MSHEPTHASFFSGVGGLDLGLERAGWRTVSFSEIDPYASAVLAERWPGVPNLGSIVDLANGLRLAGGAVEHERLAAVRSDVERDEDARRDAWHSADLWTGGFPCQDLSVAGKRRGMGAGTRSGLAYAFLELVGRHRPRFVLLENVPGLLSSHGGKDFGTLLATLVELGYGVGYRVLDARYFGVPQRRRRVFILGDSLGGRAGAERAAEVLSVGSRCRRHPPTGIEAGEGTAAGPGRGIAHALTSSRTRSGRYDANGETFAIGSSPDSRGVRAPDGLAGRSHDRTVAATLNSGGNDGGFRTEPGEHLVRTLTVGGRDRGAGSSTDNTPFTVSGASGMTDDPMLPLGLDSHRYRCCGNGVVADVSEWIGARLLSIIEAGAVA